MCMCMHVSVYVCGDILICNSIPIPIPVPITTPIPICLYLYLCLHLHIYLFGWAGSQPLSVSASFLQAGWGK